MTPSRNSFPLLTLTLLFCFAFEIVLCDDAHAQKQKQHEDASIGTITVPEEDVRALRDEIERQTGAQFSIEELELYTAMDPLPEEGITTSPNAQPGGSQLDPCFTRCGEEHTACLEELWFFPEFRCGSRRRDCELKCMNDDLDIYF